MDMDLKLFWLLGVVAIGGGMYLLGRVINTDTTHTDKDNSMVRAVVGWGIFMELGWIFLGALKFFLF